jgi:CheY-like chemotaxis protein
MAKHIQHICMAEDDPDDYYIFKKVLNEVNSAIKLTWFQHGEHLLEFLKTGNDLPELILLDVNMPKMDGHTCLVTIKRDLSMLDIPVIMFSTEISSSSISKASEAGALNYYQKPFSLDEYRIVINEMLAALSA